VTAPNPHPLASADLRVAHRWMEPCECPPDFCSCPAGDPRSVIAALVQEVEDWRETFGAGRLLPPDTDTRTEYSVSWPRAQRTVWVGPWRPVPSTPTACCDMHNQHCEPPADLCCRDCTEAAHDNFPVRHADGTACVMDRPVPSTPTKEI
jgi:hypothetical protein